LDFASDTLPNSILLLTVVIDNLVFVGDEIFMMMLVIHVVVYLDCLIMIRRAPHLISYFGLFCIVVNVM
jgi:hypothetical protein